MYKFLSTLCSQPLWIQFCPLPMKSNPFLLWNDFFGNENYMDVVTWLLYNHILKLRIEIYICHSLSVFNILSLMELFEIISSSMLSTYSYIKNPNHRSWSDICMEIFPSNNHNKIYCQWREGLKWTLDCRGNLNLHTKVDSLKFLYLYATISFCKLLLRIHVLVSFIYCGEHEMEIC